MLRGDVGCSPNDERITTSEQRENVISDKGEALDEIRQDPTPTDRVKGRGKELVGGGVELGRECNTRKFTCTMYTRVL